MNIPSMDFHDAEQWVAQHWAVVAFTGGAVFTAAYLTRQAYEGWKAGAPGNKATDVKVSPSQACLVEAPSAASSTSKIVLRLVKSVMGVSIVVTGTFGTTEVFASTPQVPIEDFMSKPIQEFGAAWIRDLTAVNPVIVIPQEVMTGLIQDERNRTSGMKNT